MSFVTVGTLSEGGTLITFTSTALADQLGDGSPLDLQGATKVKIDGFKTIAPFALAASDITAVTFTNSSNLEIIGSNAFESARSLTAITIPASVTAIGPKAFQNATSLKTVTFASSSNLLTIGGAAFRQATSLTAITIPASVNSIGDYAFYQATSLETVTFASPSSLLTIGFLAFGDATSLTAITIPASVTSIGVGAFVTTTSLTAFTVGSGNANYSSLDGVLFNKDQTTLLQYSLGNSRTTYTIPASVTSLAPSALLNAINLTAFTVQAGSQDFSADSNGVLFDIAKTTLIQYPIGNQRTTYTIPANVEIIEVSAFYGASKLITITIPASVTEIGFKAFYIMSSLTTFTVQPANTNYSSREGVLFNKAQTSLIQYPTNKSLSTYTIPSTVQTIGNYAFGNAVKLTNIIIPDSVTEIVEYAFEYATGLTEVTIPLSVTAIGDYTFYEAINLKTVYIDQSTLNTLGLQDLVYGVPGQYFYEAIVTLEPLPVPVPVNNICFPAGTPVQTDQGYINIEKLDTSKNTIKGQVIKYITQTVTLDKYLIRFEKNSIERNVPQKTTIMTKDHMIQFQGKLVPAERFLQYSRDIKKVKYTGEILYNVLLARHGRINVNGLTCETLHPDNIIAKLYTTGYTMEEKNTIIIQMNDSLAKRDLQGYKEVVTKLHNKYYQK
jgi:hypothetical protein